MNTQLTGQTSDIPVSSESGAKTRSTGFPRLDAKEISYSHSCKSFIIATTAATKLRV